jgi:hypothetical protein
MSVLLSVSVINIVVGVCLVLMDCSSGITGAQHDMQEANGNRRIKKRRVLQPSANQADQNEDQDQGFYTKRHLFSLAISDSRTEQIKNDKLHDVPPQPSSARPLNILAFGATQTYCMVVV